MSTADHSSTPSSRGRWTLIVLLLAPAVVVPLLVPLYARTDPELFGFPFYFWFQLALIPMAVVLTVAAYYLSKSGEPRARDQVREPEQEPRP